MSRNFSILHATLSSPFARAFAFFACILLSYLRRKKERKGLLRVIFCDKLKKNEEIFNSIFTNGTNLVISRNRPVFLSYSNPRFPKGKPKERSFFPALKNLFDVFGNSSLYKTATFPFSLSLSSLSLGKISRILVKDS